MLKTLFQGRGNYEIEHDGKYIYHYYHHNRIAVVDTEAETFTLSSCGYSGHRSTTRALNDLEKHYTRLGYRLLGRD